MPKLPSVRNILILLGIWAAVLYAHHQISSCSCAGSRGGIVYRGSVTGETDGRVNVKIAGCPSLDSVRAVCSPIAGGGARPSVGQRVFVEVRDGGEATVVGLVRDGAMLYLAGIFLSLFVIVGGKQALGSTAGLIAAFAGTLFVLVPMIMAGVHPQLAVLATSAGLAVLISVLISGVRRRTAAIIAGCMGGLLITCILAAISSSFLRMTGVYSALTQDLWYTGRGTGLDFVKLLSAGITLGALGVVIDLATAVASAVFEVAEVNPAMSRRNLALAGLRVGRDVMGTELNTLVFAYAGAQVGLLLLPFFGPKGYELPIIQILSLQGFAAEAAHILVGTAGLILTIPLTALVAGLTAPGRRVRADNTPKRRRASLKSRAFWPATVTCWTALAVVALWFCARSYHTYAEGGSGKAARRLVRAEVLAADPPAARFEVRANAERKQNVNALLLSGPMAATEMTIYNAVSGFPGHDKLVRPGDRVLVKTVSSEGRAVASIIDHDRGRSLIAMVWAVGLLVMAVGGRNGLRAMGALALCAPVLGLGLYLIAARSMPALPVLAVAALLICAAVFIVLAGPTRKAACAAGGAFGGIAVGGICAAAAGSLMGFTGLQSDSLFAIRMFGSGGSIDYRGLLSAGILLGIVGVAMDVAIAVASSAGEIASAKPTADRAELWRRGMSVGRKVMCTMVLALLFAYLGANIPLLILPQAAEDMPMMLALNNDRFACEELRIIAGGIGVVAAIPATAFLASVFIKKAAYESEG